MKTWSVGWTVKKLYGGILTVKPNPYLELNSPPTYPIEFDEFDEPYNETGYDDFEPYPGNLDED